MMDSYRLYLMIAAMVVMMAIFCTLFRFMFARRRMCGCRTFQAPGSRRRNRQDRLPPEVHEMQLGDLVHREPSVSGEEKLFECPLCGNKVRDSESRCPGCGAEFE